MYKVELTEKEIREVGVNRYIKTVWKRKLITFVVGLSSTCAGAYYWDYTAGKLWLFLAGAVWVLFTFYQARQEGKAGRKYLEYIKKG